MSCRNVFVLLLVWAWLLAPGHSALAEQWPTPPAATMQIRAGEPVAFRLPAPSPATPPQSAPVSQPLDLPQPDNLAALGDFSEAVDCEALVQHALANNREIQAARYRARALGARVPQAASLPDPKLMTTVFLESLQTAAGAQDVAMSLSQQFPWFGKRGLRSEMAYYDAMAAYARAVAVELKVVERVRRAYSDLYFVENAVRETRRLEPRLEDVIKIAQTKYTTSVPGTGLETVLLAQIELSKLKTRLVALENDRLKAQARLAATLHLPPQTRLTAVDRVDRRKVAHTAQLLVELAELYQPELAARRREVSRDRSATALASRNYWPDVTLSLNWYEIDSTGISPVANGRDAYSMGVGVDLPIYRARLNAALREAQYRAASSTRQFAAARDEVHSEVQTLYAQFAEQDQVLGILESEILPRAGQALELSMESYRTGRLAFEQLIDAYRTLLNYRIDFHRHTAMREQAVASLERAVGSVVTAEPGEARPAE